MEVRKKFTLRLTEDQHETLLELQQEKMSHLSLNDIVIGAILKLSKEYFK